MEYVDLKSCNLESKLLKFGFKHKEITEIDRDAQYYDKYILVASQSKKGFIKIWHQHVSDPYFDMKLDECELVNFKGSEMKLEDYMIALDSIFSVPQIVRCKLGDYTFFKEHGFQDICDASNIESSRIIPVVFPGVKSTTTPRRCEYMRQMKSADLKKVQDLFSQEYALRYRAVPVMYAYDPKSCAVYDDGLLKAVVFGQEEPGAFHVHQVFIAKKYRGKLIDKDVFQWVYAKAINLGKTQITGAIRGNLVRYYKRIGLLREEDILKKDIQQYIIRFKMPLSIEDKF